MSTLLAGWALQTIADVTLPFQTIDPTKEPSREFIYIDIGAIDNSNQTIAAPRTICGKDAPSRARRVVKSGDVLFSTVRTYLRNIAVVTDQFDGALASTGLAVLRPAPELDSRYLFYWVCSEPFISGISKAQDGTMYPAIRDSDLGEALIALPPFQEQRRIVGTLDSRLARSSVARNELAHIPKLVARYKQAVLLDAFRGNLTADWRASSSSNIHGILNKERIAILPKEQFGPLPRGWAWVSAGSLCTIKGGIALGKKRSAGTELVEVPYLRVANVQRGWLNLEEIKTIPVTHKEAAALYLQPGDVLMNEGGDRDKLGRGWVWDGQISNCIHQNHVFRLRPRLRDLPGRYISYYANEFAQRYFVDEGKQTTNLASISLGKVSALPIPVAPPEEMMLIVERIERSFQKIDGIALDAARAMALLDRLDESFLAKAFRGELATEEPAKQVLESVG